MRVIAQANPTAQVQICAASCQQPSPLRVRGTDLAFGAGSSQWFQHQALKLLRDQQRIQGEENGVVVAENVTLMTGMLGSMHAPTT